MEKTLTDEELARSWAWEAAILAALILIGVIEHFVSW
jgi:hypothetical protein